MDKVQKHSSFNTNTPPSESYKNGNFVEPYDTADRSRVSRFLLWVTPDYLSRHTGAGGWRRLQKGELVTCTLHQILLGWSNQ
jgi:hypothetical protein